LKILVVHEVSYTRKIIYEIHEFPELLALRGHDVTFFQFDEGANFKSLEKDRHKLINGRVHSTARLRLVTPHRFGLPAIDRLWAIASSIPALHGLMKKERFDVVLNYAVPTFGLQVMFFGRHFGIPVMHRALDVSSAIRESIGNRLIARFEKWVFLMASSISANNPAMEKYVITTGGERVRNKLEVHYPPLDLDIFAPQTPDARLKKRLGIDPEDQVIMYMGSFFYFSGLSDVIRALAPEMRVQPNLKFLLIGGGEQDGLLRNLVMELNLTRQVIFSGIVEFRELTRYMSLADVAISPLLISEVAGAAFPQKVLQYMAVGIPVVSTKLDGLYAAFGDKSGIIWALNPRDVTVKAIEVLSKNRLEIRTQTKLQIASISNLFTPERVTSALESSLAGITNKGKVR